MRQLITIRPSDRPWQVPFAAALASGLPLLVGVYFGRLDYGLVSSLGDLAFLYLTETSLHHRMLTLMARAFAMTACYSQSVMSHLLPTVLLLAFVIETVVVLHYGFATIFITPMNNLLADAATLGHGSVTDLIQARFFDTLQGCLVALFGGFYLHNVRFWTVVGLQMLRLIPARLFKEPMGTLSRPR